MNQVPDEWFDVLNVEADDVARVGYSLAAYTNDYESLRSVEDEEVTIEQRLMQATTLADAASLLALVDILVARTLLARAATILESVGAPDAWTMGLASHGRWEPSLDSRYGRIPDRPSDGMSELVALYTDMEQERAGSDSAWGVAAEFRHNPRQGWGTKGVPAIMFAEFAERAREGDRDGVVTALGRIIGRSDETIRFAQERDRWHWVRFVADVPLVDPELLALGTVASRVDASIVRPVAEGELTPARVALLVGMRNGDGEFFDGSPQ